MKSQTSPIDPFARFHRQMLLPGWGPEAQSRLALSHAVVVGLGALGCYSADMLARAGVGTLTLIDRDLVEFTNLQRQPLYTEADADAALPKAQAAASRLRAVNSAIAITAVAADLTSRNAASLIRCPDILIDGTDNLETRYLLNDLAVKWAVPFAYAGVIAARGLQMTVIPRNPSQAPGARVVTPCLRCVFEELPAPGTMPTCDTAGVFGPAVTIAAGAQAADALKILAGRSDLLSHSLLEFDLWENTRRRLDLKTLGPRADCPCCGLGRFEFLEGGRESESTVLCGQNAVQVTPPHAASSINLEEFAVRWRTLGAVTSSAFMVRVTLTAGEGLEVSLFKDGRAIVRGTTSPAVARSTYAKLVGS
jgi:molybdopterin-synthase adenylyltransferase